MSARLTSAVSHRVGVAEARWLLEARQRLSQRPRPARPRTKPSREERADD